MRRRAGAATSARALRDRCRPLAALSCGSLAALATALAPLACGSLACGPLARRTFARSSAEARAGQLALRAPPRPRRRRLRRRLRPPFARGGRRTRLRQRSEDRLIVVVLVVEEIGAARCEVRAERVFSRDDRRGLGARLVLVVVVRRSSSSAGEPARAASISRAFTSTPSPLVSSSRGVSTTGGRALLALLLFPFAQRENAGTNLRDRNLLVVLLDGRREPVAHRDLGRLAHVREEVPRDGELGDLFVVERLARFAEHLRSRFDERHVLFRMSPVAGDPLGSERLQEALPGHLGRSIGLSSPPSRPRPTSGGPHTKRVSLLLARFADRVKHRHRAGFVTHHRARVRAGSGDFRCVTRRSGWCADVTVALGTGGRGRPLPRGKPQRRRGRRDPICPEEAARATLRVRRCSRHASERGLRRRDSTLRWPERGL